MNMIRWPNGIILIDRTWDDFKKIIDGTEKSLRLQYEYGSSQYEIFAVDNSIIYRHIIYDENAEPVGWTQQQIDDNAAALVDFQNNFQSDANKQLSPQLTNDTRLSVSPRVPLGSEWMAVTHNFCDKTTWYQQSSQVIDEAAVDSGDGLTWNLQHQFIIDNSHGKIYNEDSVASNYSISVKVDGVEQTMRPPFSINGGDYIVNYDDGKIVFFNIQAGKTVLVTYYYATTSDFEFKPSSNEILNIENSETQLSADIIMNDTFCYLVYGHVLHFVPQLAQSNGGPYPDDTEIELLQVKYKRMQSFMEEAQGVYPTLPAIGGEDRGMSSSIYGFPFKYNTLQVIDGSKGMKIVIKLENDRAYAGELASATLYGSTDIL